MSRERCSFTLGSVWTSSCISADLRVSKAAILVLSNWKNFEGWSFRCCLFSQAAIWAKLGANYQTMVLSPRKDLRSVKGVQCWSSLMVLVVCDAITKRLRRMTCPRQSTILSEMHHFLSLEVAPALLKRVCTLPTYVICASRGSDSATVRYM